MTTPIKNYGPEFLADLRAEAEAEAKPAEPVAWPSGIDIADEIDAILPVSMGYSTRAAVEVWWRDLVASKLSKLAAPAAPAPAPLTDEQIEAIGHRKAWRYKHSSDPAHSSTYTFNRTCLLDFARAAIAASKGGAA